MNRKKGIIIGVVVVLIVAVIAVCVIATGKGDNKKTGKVGTSGNISAGKNDEVSIETDETETEAETSDDGESVEVITRDPNAVTEITEEFFDSNIVSPEAMKDIISTEKLTTEYGGYTLSCPYYIYDENTNIAQVEIDIEANGASNILSYDGEGMVCNFGVANELSVCGNEGNSLVSMSSTYDGTVLRLFYSIMGAVDKFDGTIHFADVNQEGNVADIVLKNTCTEKYTEGGITLTKVGAVVASTLTDEEVRSLENDQTGEASLEIFDKYSKAGKVSINGQETDLDSISATSAATMNGNTFTFVYVFIEPLDISSITGVSGEVSSL